MPFELTGQLDQLLRAHRIRTRLRHKTIDNSQTPDPPAAADDPSPRE